MKIFFTMLLSCIFVVPATNVLAKKSGNSTTETVEFVVPIDMQSCLVNPILLQSVSSDSSGLSTADAEALVDALGSVQAAVTGSVELSITRHGNHGSVHKAELSGVMENGQIVFLSVAAAADGGIDAEADVETDALANVDTQIDSSFNNSYSGRGSFGSTVVSNISSTILSAADSQSISQSDAWAGSLNYGNTSTEASIDSSNASEVTAHVVVEGANIDRFESSLNMSPVFLHSIDTKAVAGVLAEAYASSYAASFAKSHGSVTASGDYTGKVHIGWPFNINMPFADTFGQDDPEVVYEQVYKELLEEFSASAETQAEAVAKLLSSAELKVNLGVRFEDLPGNTDILEATGSTSAVLTCNLSNLVSSMADIEE